MKKIEIEMILTWWDGFTEVGTPVGWIHGGGDRIRGENRRRRERKRRGFRERGENGEEGRRMGFYLKEPTDPCPSVCRRKKNKKLNARFNEIFTRSTRNFHAVCNFGKLTNRRNSDDHKSVGMGQVVGIPSVYSDRIPTTWGFRV